MLVDDEEKTIKVEEDKSKSLRRQSSYCHYLYSNLSSYRTRSKSVDNSDEDYYCDGFVWDWPFSDDRFAKCLLTKEKFFVCLPFKNGTGESKGTTKKFEDFSISNISWSVGLCKDGEFGTYFWRLEVEIIRALNIIILNAWRDISRSYDKGKRLRRIRKVYRLPYHYDVSTLKTSNYDWAIVIEASRRLDGWNRPVPFRRVNSF